MDPKWPPQLPLIDFSLFPVSLTHLGAPGGHRSQTEAIVWADFFLPDTPPPPPNPVRFLWSKMGRTGFPHIELHILCSTRIYWSHFRPSEVFFWSFWANKANIPPFPNFGGGRQLGNGWVK